MTRPLLADLCCGAGCASRGYVDAGFDVVGIDLHPQPSYPWPFIRMDALTFVRRGGLSGFDAAHGSAPCQRWTGAQAARQRASQHPDVLTPLRGLLMRSGLPYVLENVPGAPMVRPVQVCGTAFGLRAAGRELRRHRLFEGNVPLSGTACDHQLPAMSIFGHGDNADAYERHGGNVPIEAKRQAMGVWWCNRDELAEGIPPAYTRFIGAQLLRAVSRETGEPAVAS